MYWIISFIISWILFFILIDKKELRVNWFGGLFALMLASFLDHGGIKLELYKFNDLVISWFNCSAFYKFGPIVTMGILFCQSVPEKPWMQALNILAFTVFFNAMEYLVIKSGSAHYIHWSLLASFAVNILTFATMTWITTAFLRKKRRP